MSDLHPYTPTPGPWRVREGDVTQVDDDKGKQIADCDFFFLERPQQCIANARLIAAAPDLLSMVKYLLYMASISKGHVSAIARAEAQKCVDKAEGSK